MPPEKCITSFFKQERIFFYLELLIRFWQLLQISKYFFHLKKTQILEIWFPSGWCSSDESRVSSVIQQAIRNYNFWSKEMDTKKWIKKGLEVDLDCEVTWTCARSNLFEWPQAEHDIFSIHHLQSIVHFTSYGIWWGRKHNIPTQYHTHVNSNIQVSTYASNSFHLPTITFLPKLLLLLRGDLPVLPPLILFTTILNIYLSCNNDAIVNKNILQQPFLRLPFFFQWSSLLL